MQATYCEKVLIVKFLLEHGAEVNLRDKDGLVSLYFVTINLKFILDSSTLCNVGK